MQCSAESETERITLMGGAQSGKTSGVIENGLLYWTDLGEPCNVLYLSATLNLVQDFVQVRMDNVYRQAGVKLHKEVVDYENKKITKHTGDKLLKKTGAGFVHIFKSYGSAKELRTLDFRVVLLDEVDELLTNQSNSKQGSILKIIEERTHTYANRKKIVMVSTPLLKRTSIVYKSFMEGDQRYCHIECPYCFKKQKLEFKNLKWEFENDEQTKVKYDSVYMECIYNKCKIKNNDKTSFLTLEKIEWIAENSKHAQKNHKSYQFSQLYSPIGMTSWEGLAQKFVDCKNDSDYLQTFYNTNLGLPYDDVITAQRPELLHVLQEDYYAGTLPNLSRNNNITPLVATMGVDVQGNRLECELVGWTKNEVSFSLGYYVIAGDTSANGSGAWENFKLFLQEANLPLNPALVLIDAGFNTQAVNYFCNGTQRIRPCKGGMIMKNNRYRENVLTGFSGFLGSVLTHYSIDTNIYKTNLYNNLYLRKNEKTKELPHGYCMFPRDYTKEYFKMLQSEEQIAEYDLRTGKFKRFIFKSRHGTRSEALDCRVYAMAGLDIFANKLCKSLNLNLKSTDWDIFWKAAELQYKKYPPNPNKKSINNDSIVQWRSMTEKYTKRL